MEENNKKVVNEVLNMFTGDRIWYEKPFTIKNKCYATNGYCCISINKELAQEYPELTEYSQDDFIKTIERENNIGYYIPFAEFDNFINHFPEVDKNVHNRCTACDGSGHVEWEFSNNNEDYNKEIQG